MSKRSVPFDALEPGDVITVFTISPAGCPRGEFVDITSLTTSSMAIENHFRRAQRLPRKRRPYFLRLRIAEGKYGCIWTRRITGIQRHRRAKSRKPTNRPDAEPRSE